GVVLAFLMFQLEHFESFLWSGASIDHFQVVTLVVGVIALLAAHPVHPRLQLAGAVLLGFLATFTLAQGTLAWPAGAGVLWQQRRWRHLGVWTISAILVMAAFLQGDRKSTRLNSSHVKI